MTLKDKQLKMQEELLVLMWSESLMSQLLLHLLTECKRNTSKQSLCTISVEEHSIFLSLKLITVLSKSKLQTEIQHVVVRILMVLYKDSYLNNSKSNQALMYLRIKQPFKDSEKLQKRLKFN